MSKSVWVWNIWDQNLVTKSVLGVEFMRASQTLHFPGLLMYGKSILQVPDTGMSSIDEYWNIFGVPVLPENVIFTFFRTCWSYLEAYNTGMQKWSSIVQYSCTSIWWDLKYTFSCRLNSVQENIPASAPIPRCPLPGSTRTTPLMQKDMFCDRKLAVTYKVRKNKQTNKQTNKNNTKQTNKT